MRMRWLGFSVFAVLAACSRAGDVANAAGVSTVVVSEDELASLVEWDVDPSPLAIGGIGDDPDHPLHNARSPISMSNGRTAVVNEQSELLIYDSLGKFVARKGRRGGGPGEFRQLWTILALDSDAILALDIAAVRVSVLDADGNFVRSYEMATRARVFAALPTGALFYMTERLPCNNSFARSAPTVVLQDTVDLVRVSVGAIRSDTIAKVAGEWFQCWGGDWDGIPLSGELFLAAGTSTVVVAQGDQFQLRWFDADGHATQVANVTAAQTPVLDEDILRFDSARIAGRRCSTPSCGAPPNRQFPKHFPMIADVVIDRLGQTWARRRSDFGAKESQWVVFDVNGHAIAQARLPAALNVNDIGRDFVLGLFGDSDGVQSVRRYKLRR